MTYFVEPHESAFRIENDPSGEVKIVAGKFTVCSFHYDYRYTCNATVRRHAEICLKALHDASPAPDTAPL